MKMSKYLVEGEPVPDNIIDCFLSDKGHSDDWREEAIHAYDFVVGRQWTDDEIKSLKTQRRPVVVFNRTKTVIDAVSGNEMGNQREVRYIPREMGDVKANEVISAAAKWFRDQSHAETQESDSFSDTLITGMGWTDTYIDFDLSPDGQPVIERIDPLEMAWERTAKGKNLSDAKRLWRFRNSGVDDAQELAGEEYTREDLNAGWTEASSASDYGLSNSDASDDDGRSQKTVTIVQVQWAERQAFYQVADPLSGETVEMSADEYMIADKRMNQLIGQGLDGQKFTKLVRMQALLGHKVLKVTKAASQKGFTWNCITGFRDRNKGLFFGMVRAMIDPQTWSNKGLSQVMHIMNINAKGGIMAERGAFEDQAQAEKSWSDPTKITWLANGALQGGKIREKTAATIPTGFQQLTEMGISSIRDVTGVSLELLGLREANQAASLEYQRRQSGMAILQPLFSSLKHYREMQGKVMLDYIVNDLSDGRLIKIAGDGLGQYVPLISDVNTEYDVVIEDAPTAPNHKEMVWQMFMQILPTIGRALPPQFLISMMKYSPLPTEATDKLAKMMEQQGQPDPQQEERNQIEKAGVIAGIEKVKSETAENQADTAKKSAEAQKITTETALNQMAQIIGSGI